MPVETVVYVNAVVWLAASLQGITGFGFMMLAVPGLILGFPAQVAVPALILMYLPLATGQALLLRRDVDLPVLGWLTASAVAGLPIGALVLKHTDTATMQRGIGLVMVALALLLQVRPGPPFGRERAARVSAGFLSGILAASTSVSGPPVVLLGLKQRWGAARFRATLLTYFLVVSACCLPFYWGLGLLDRASTAVALWGFPGVALGFATGAWLRKYVEGKVFRWVTVGMVLGGGLAAVML